MRHVKAFARTTLTMVVIVLASIVATKAMAGAELWQVVTVWISIMFGCIYGALIGAGED